MRRRQVPLRLRADRFAVYTAWTFAPASRRLADLSRFTEPFGAMRSIDRSPRLLWPMCTSIRVARDALPAQPLIVRLLVAVPRSLIVRFAPFVLTLHGGGGGGGGVVTGCV